jgi:NADH:ubiquinone reductase (H+-translocating)
MSLNIPSSNLPRVVIIGGGFAGLSLIRHINKKEFQVILLDKNNYHTFQPLLYQVATGGLEVGSIAYPLRRYIKRYRNVIFRMAEVLDIAAEKKEINTSIGILHYDYLVIATGSESNFFGNGLLEKKAMQMKNIPQALDIRSILLQNFELATQTTDPLQRKKLMTFVIAGGGPTGVEMAGALAELKKHVLVKDYPELDLHDMEIYLLEGTDRVLGTMSPSASEKAFRFLTNMDVKILLGTKLKDFDGEKVVIDNGPEIPSKSLLWSAGIKGTVPPGLSPDIIIRGNRIRTDIYNRVENYENVFAVGDAAACVTDKTPGGHPMVASVAIQQGKLIASNLLQVKKGLPLRAFAYLNKGTLATIGRNKAVADLRRLKFQGTLAWFIWIFIHLLAIVGFRSKMITLVDWFWNYISYDRALRLIIRPYKEQS